MNIILTGFMGTGKTAVGRRVADQLKRKFVDLDQLIELRAGRSVADIFSWQGEPAFRALEREVVREAVKQLNAVIATGGGALLDPANHKSLSKNGQLVCLTARAETIAERLHADTSRPLLAGMERAERIAQLLKEREVVYSACPIQISTDGKSPDTVAAEVIAAVTAQKKIS